MKEFIIILLFIFSLIFFIKAYKRNVEIDDITNKIKEENEKLLKDKESIINEIKFLNEKKEEKNKDLEQLESVTNNLDAAARQAFSEYCDSLNKEYYTTEAEYDAAIADLKKTYNNIQDKLMEDVGKIKKELDKITATRAAAMEAQLKEKEIKEKKAFYCPQIPEIDLKDAKTLRDIEYKLNNPRVLRMLIWSSFYQKPINQVCANVLGGATVEKTGIYKITNQKTELVYIGQAVDIATR